MQKPISITITPGSVVTVVAVLASFWLVFYLRDLVLLVITAVVLASALEPATARLMRWGIPRIISVVLLYISILSLLVGMFYAFVPQLVAETNAFVQEVPVYLETLDINPADIGFTAEGDGDLTTWLLDMQQVVRQAGGGVVSAASSIFGGVMSFVLIVVLSFYFAVQERGIDDFLRMVTPIKKQGYILGLWKRAQYKMGRWMQGQLLLSLIVGVLVYISLLLLGVPYALLLAIVAGLLELIPVFGSILAAVPAIAIAFLSGGTPLALLVILVYVVVNQLQANVIYPLVVQKVLGIAPLVVILAIIVGVQLGGFLGILIAVPVAAALQEYINDLQKERTRKDEEKGEEYVLVKEWREV
jgi:predicted PurR-regulated permease PerM